MTFIVDDKAALEASFDGGFASGWTAALCNDVAAYGGLQVAALSLLREKIDVKIYARDALVTDGSVRFNAPVHPRC